MMTDKNQRINFVISARAKDELANIAKERGRQLAFIAREAIDFYLKESKEPVVQASEEKD